MLVCAAGCLSAGPVLNEAGDLQHLLDNTVIPSEFSPDKYRLPTAGELTAFRNALGHVLAGDLPAASDDAALANYDVVSYTDNISGDVFTLLREKNSDRHWGGIYVVDQTPERALVVQCPHPLFDGVRAPSADIFMDTNAFVYFMAGTHRKNSPIESLCDHDPEDPPYRISDMAHAPDSIFQAAHEVIEETIARTVSLSFHGMAEDTDPSDVAISNGTPRVFPGNSLSRSLAARMNQILVDAEDPRYAVSHQEPGENPALSGSTNTQGRHTNGSSEPCTVEARTAIFPERFIHMECDPDVRSGDPVNWAFIIQTLNELIPLFADPVPDLHTGDLVITEFMADPAQVGDASGEYIELFNASGAPITMTDWAIYDSQFNAITFSGVIQPGDLFVVGVGNNLNGAAPGGAPDAVWQNTSGDFTLTNTGDSVIILDENGDFVASVIFEDGEFLRHRSLFRTCHRQRPSERPNPGRAIRRIDHSLRHRFRLARHARKHPVARDRSHAPQLGFRLGSGFLHHLSLHTRGDLHALAQPPARRLAALRWNGPGHRRWRSGRLHLPAAAGRPPLLPGAPAIRGTRVGGPREPSSGSPGVPPINPWKNFPPSPDPNRACFAASTSLLPQSPISYLLSAVPPVDAELVAVRVNDDGRPAGGHVEGFHGKGHAVGFEVRDRFVEVLHLQHELGSVAGRLHEGFVADAQRVRADLILDPELIALAHFRAGRQSDDVLVKGAGAGFVGDGIGDEGEFEDFHGRCFPYTGNRDARTSRKLLRVSRRQSRPYSGLE